MSTQWLAIQSFQHSQNLLAAINTLAIHIKSKLAGVLDGEPPETVENARGIIAAFLNDLKTFVEEAAETRPMIGADTRLRQLAKSFLAAKRDRRRFHSAWFRKALPKPEELLDAESPEERRALLESLTELRTLIEEHVQADELRILGDF